MSHVRYFFNFFLGKAVKLIDGGSVINGPTLSSFLAMQERYKWNFTEYILNSFPLKVNKHNQRCYLYGIFEWKQNPIYNIFKTYLISLDFFLKLVIWSTMVSSQAYYMRVIRKTISNTVRIYFNTCPLFTEPAPS